MMEHDQSISLLAMVGSLRADSYSRAVLRGLIKTLPARVSVDEASLDSMPFYNADLDRETGPSGVEAFKRHIESCDGIVVVTPEYNYGLPAVLKNAIDWASRPAYASVLKDKPVACITLSPGQFGGVRAHAHLQQLFAATLSRQITAPQVAIGNIASKIADGVLIDPDTLAFAHSTLDRLIAGIDTLRRTQKSLAD